MTQTILVYGANGAQMNAGTHALIKSGHKLRVLCRTQSNADEWEANGAYPFIGEMGNLDSLISASQGCDAIFLLVPLIRSEANLGITYGLNALKAAKIAGVSRVIWNTGGPIMDESSETDSGAVVLRQLRKDQFSFLGLTPITYMENLLGPWTTIGLSKGKLPYPTPANFQMQWGAAIDFGRIADKALEQDNLPNDILRLGGPSPLDGHDLARIIGGVLGKDVTFEVMPARDFQTILEQSAGPRVAAMIGGMYGAIQADPAQFQPGFLTDAGDIERRFDLKLTSLADWTKSHADALQSR